MKKFNPISLICLSFLIGGMLLASCKGGNKTTPEEEVRNYGKYFVEKASASQIDSLAATYADIVKADSLVNIDTDTILVVETNPGQFDVTLAKGITLKVTRSDDGNITVTESRGVFAFPGEQLDIAKKTGMWEDNLTDSELSERLKDEDFFKYLNSLQSSMSDNIITLDRKLHITKDAEFSLDDWKGYYNITNNSDYPIKGSDYSVQTKWEWMAQGEYESGRETKAGKDIAPHSTIKFPVSGSGRSSEEVTGIKIKIPQDELVKRFAPFTGNEYQQYLDSKK